jgi:hypothetical protein
LSGAELGHPSQLESPFSWPRAGRQVRPVWHGCCEIGAVRRRFSRFAAWSGPIRIKVSENYLTYDGLATKVGDSLIFGGLGDRLGGQNPLSMRLSANLLMIVS